jgi:hypothetical protein
MRGTEVAEMRLLIVVIGYRPIDKRSRKTYKRRTTNILSGYKN